MGKVATGADSRPVGDRYKAAAARVNYLDLVRSAFGEPDKSGKYLCRFHPDKKASFNLYANNTRGHCFSPTCGFDGDALDFLARWKNISLSEAVASIDPLSDPVNPTASQESEGKNEARIPVGAPIYYVVNDPETSEPLYREGRQYYRGEITGKKSKRQWMDVPSSKNGTGETTWRKSAGDLTRTRRPLYGAREVAAAPQPSLVFVVEGPPKVERLRAEGLLAVSGMNGANGWPKDKAEARYLRGHNVVILPDVGTSGETYQAIAGQSIADNEPASLRVLRFDGLSNSEDVKDWFDRGGSAEELLRLAAAAPAWEPTPDTLPIRPIDTTQPIEDGPSEDIVDHWPVIANEAFYGLAGDIVRAVEPHSEGDPAAMLAQFIVGMGNNMSKGPYIAVGPEKHCAILDTIVVGPTGAGRKGTSWAPIEYFLREAEFDWAQCRIKGGTVSGEGLIYHVRDPVYEGEECVDQGEPDKRLLVIEPEFSRLLKAASRDSNTITEIVRKSYDCVRVLSTLAKNSQNKATDARISFIGHITIPELQRHFTSTDTLNGFGNRFIWICSRASKDLHDGGDFFSVNWTPLIERLKEARLFANGITKVTRDEDASEIWRDLYPKLNAGRPGALGAMLGRAAPHVLRLSLIYALLDCSRVIRAEHIEAAVALWEYAEASAVFIFGDDLSDPKAQKLITSIREAPEGLTRTEITRGVFGGNIKSDDLAKLLTELLTSGMVHRTYARTEGAKRDTERWHAGRAKPAEG